MLKLECLKTNWIEQSAAKARIEQGSETISKESRLNCRNDGIDKMINILYNASCVNYVKHDWRYNMNKSSTKEYQVWKRMKARCYSPCNKNMGNYQKNNIVVCDRWKNNFDNFLEDMGHIPNKDYSLERINNKKDYEPSNCKWIHKSEQSKNRSSVKIFFHDGEYKILKDWARHFGIKYTTLYHRIYRNGLSFEEAIQKDPYNRMIKMNGEEMILKNWCKELNMHYGNVVSRIHRGWSVEKSLSVKVPSHFVNKI